MANQQSGLDGLSLPVAILIGSIIIAGSILYAGAHLPVQIGQVKQTAKIDKANGGGQPSPVAQAVDVKAVKTDGDPVIGSPSAPVAIAYWYDYQCPFCQANEETVMSQVVADYVRTGKIRVVFKDLQFLGPDSTTLGIASRAVWEVAPSMFYDWHKAIFDNQGKENSGWATKDKIRSITAGVLGNDKTDKVMAIMVSKAKVYQAAMDADKQEGSALGIRSTPTSVIGKTLVVGAKSYAEIKADIDAALK